MDTKPTDTPPMPLFDDVEREMLLTAVSDRIYKLEAAIRKNSQTQLKMEDRLRKWLTIERKLKYSATSAVPAVMNTSVFYNRIEYNVEHTSNKLQRIRLLDNDVTNRFDERTQARILHLAIEKWKAEILGQETPNG